MSDRIGKSGNVATTITDEVAVITLKRPHKLNALTIPMLLDIASELRAFGGGRAKGIVVTGEGRAFSAGDDLNMTEDLDEAGFRELIVSFQDLTRAILESEVPIVAALNGLVVGGAAEWTLCFDARVGCPESYYLFPENRVGLTISNASTYLLPRLLGGRTLPLVLSGERIPAEEAHRLGLIDYLVPSADVVTTAVELILLWKRPGTMTHLHLKLLRPPLEEIERAMENENSIAEEVWRSGSPGAVSDALTRGHGDRS